MAAVMYGATGSSDLIELQESPYELETHLQAFLTRHPALLAGDQMYPVEPRRFVLVTAEAGIAIAEGGGSYFSLDHLFIDQDGIPTLVEVKRSSDTRLRREVIGQMLEYAANACAFWDPERLRTVFERRCDLDQTTPESEIGKLSPESPLDAEKLWQSVAQNLREQRLRLVFVADKFSSETQRIVAFLNQQMQNTEVYAVELRQYAGGGMRTLVPRVLNPSVLQADKRRAISSNPGEQWTAERFYTSVIERFGEEAGAVFRQIQNWAESRPQVGITFGRGNRDGSIQIWHTTRPDAKAYQSGEDVVFLTLWTYGSAEIEFQYLMVRDVFKSESNRRVLRERLTRGSTIRIDEARIDKRPNVPWSDLADSTNMQVFLDAMGWVLGELT